MSDMRFTGLPAGQASVSVQQAGQQSSLTASLPALPLVGERNCFVLGHQPVQEQWEGMSVTTFTVEGQGIGSGVYPPVYRDVAQVTTGHPNRVINDGFSDDTLMPSTYVGGTADVYRVRNGAVVQVRQSTITGGNWGKWSDIAQVSSPGYNFLFRPWYAHGARYWFGVAAVDGANAAGAIGFAAHDLPADANRASVPDNLNAASFTWQEGGALPAPTSVTVTPQPDQESSVSISWDPVAGAIGYVVFIAYSDPATFEADRYLELEDDGGDPLLTGDMVILTNRIMQPSVSMKSKRVYGDGQTSAPFISVPVENNLNLPDGDLTFAFGDWTAQDPAPDASLGTSYIRIDVKPGAGSASLMRRFWAGSAAQTYYTVPRTDQVYRWRAWIEVDRTVAMQLEMGLKGVSSKVFTLTPGWHEVVFRASAAEFRDQGQQVDFWRLSVLDRAEPVQVRVAGVQYHDEANTFHNFPAPLAELVPEGMFLRDHSLIKPGQKTTDVASLTNPPGESPRETTLEGYLRACHAVGGRPWIQIEWYHTVDDWLDLLAYVAAPVSSGHPMALKRQSNGRTAPWTEAFDHIRWEFGNESWNTLAEFWNPPTTMPDEVTGEPVGRGTIYALMCRRAVEAMQASPYWSDKISFVLGGWARSNYSFQIAEGFGLPVEIGIANYNGGWDEGNTLVTENLSSYQTTVGVVPASTAGAIDHLVDGLKALAETPGFPLTYGEDLRPTCYEAGPGFQLNGLNGASVTEAEAIVQEVVMKSRAAATGTLETMMYQALQGFAVFNFFTLTEGDRWGARASAAQGGGVYPPYALCKVVMEQMGPSSVFKATGLRPDTVELAERDGSPIFPPSGFIYGLRSHANPRRLMLVIGNRSLQQSLPLSVFSTVRSCDALTAWGNLGDYREHNRYPVGQRLVPGGGYTADPNCVDIRFDPVVLTPPTDPARIDIDATLGMPGLDDGLPPGGALLLQLDGVTFKGT